MAEHRKPNRTQDQAEDLPEGADRNHYKRFTFIAITNNYFKRQ